MKKIILTGGGTAGHVTPNLALIPHLRKAGYDILYIGSYEGIEKKLIQEAGVNYKGISTGKFRRYLSLKNLSDPFRVLKGKRQAKKIIKEYRPDVLFSKGGFVAVPVVRAAKKYHVPIIIHESDMTPGLANKLCYSAAQKVCCNFPETLKSLPEKKAVLSGSPIRDELLTGSREKGLAFTGLTGNKPVIMMMGGSLGSRIINENLRKALPLLLPDFDIVHLCGKGNLDESLKSTPGYVQFEYVSAGLNDLFALADIVLSRAGANSICELLSLRLPNLLVPLSAQVSRGDQILNADSFKKQGFSAVLCEEDMTPETLNAALRDLYSNRQAYIKAMEGSDLGNGVKTVMGLINSLSGAGSAD